MSARPQKYCNFSCVAREADGWFETDVIVQNAAPASGGSEPYL